MVAFLVFYSLWYEEVIILLEILKNDESIEDLQYKGLLLIQKKRGFRFGIDAVLLANFADVKTGAQVVDLGTGTGVIPILLAGKTKATRIVGIEIQKDVVEMALRSVALNKLTEKIQIIEGNIKDVRILPEASFDVVVSNPPYIKKNTGIRSEDESKDIARHEVLCTLEDVIKLSAKLLKSGGQFAMVHKPERLVDIMCLMRQYRIEPKYIRFVHPYADKKPNIMLVKGTLGGGQDLKFLPPLYVYKRAGEFSDEINCIYER